MLGEVLDEAQVGGMFVRTEVTGEMFLCQGSSLSNTMPGVIYITGSLTSSCSRCVQKQ